MESQLPTFSFKVQVTAKEGRQDKMEIILPWGELEGSQCGIDGVRQSLGSASVRDRSQVTQSDLQGSGWIFNRPQQTRTARKPLTIRKRAIKFSEDDISTAPLFSGGLTFSNYYMGKPNAETSATLRLALNLNPTRFAHHQRPRFGQDGSAKIEPSQLIYRKRSLPASFRGEFPLHECDNWIPDGQRYAHYFHAFLWRRFVRNYITGTLDAIRGEMDRACRMNDVDWEKGDDSPLSLRYVETYWEFVTPDPLKAVSDCERLLRAYSENPTRKRFFKTMAEGTVVHNSRSFTVSIRTGIDLVIYAKTNRRVRVEVRHRLSECPSVIGGSYVADSVQKLFQWLRMIQGDAAKIVNEMFRFMLGRNTFPKDSVSVGQFLFEMVAAIGTWEGAGTLLSMLLNNGKIVTDANLRPHVHALRDAGIITAQRKNRQRCYIIADRYKRALELLAINNKSLLEVRQRRRFLRPIRDS